MKNLTTMPKNTFLPSLTHKFVKATTFILLMMSLFSCSKECKDIEIPYEVIEDVNTPLSYLVGNATWKRIDGMALFDILGKLHSETEVTNTSEHGGVFKIVETFETTQDNMITFEDSKYINAGETVTFLFEEELQPYVTIKDRKITTDIIAPSIKQSKRITKYRKCNTCNEDDEVFINNYRADSIAIETDKATL